MHPKSHYVPTTQSCNLVGMCSGSVVSLGSLVDAAPAAFPAPLETRLGRSKFSVVSDMMKVLVVPASGRLSETLRKFKELSMMSKASIILGTCFLSFSIVSFSLSL